MMPRLSVLSLLLLTTFPLQAFADELKANSKITAATVYMDRATVTRQAEIELPAGSHTVSFAGLPAMLMPDSLRAEGSAVGSVKFGAVVYKQVMGVELSAEKAQEINGKLELLQDQRRILDAEKQSIATKKQFLSTLGTQAGLRTNEEIAEINLKPEQWVGAAQALYTGLNESMAAEVQVDAKLRTLDREIAKLQTELAQLNANMYNSFVVNVPLEAKQATRLTIDLSYQVPNASWRPLYDARIDSETGKLDLIQYGAVRQNTGEDWNGIKLALSTAQPQRGTSLPDLTPYWLDIYTPQAFGGYIGATDGAMARRKDMASVSNEMAAPASSMVMMDQASDKMAEAIVPQEAEFAQAEIKTGGFVSEYQIPGPAGVTADGTETKLMIGTFNTESKIQVHIKPQLSTDAFLVAKAKLKGESPVLPGEVSLFRDGAYVGNSTVPLLRPDEEHALFFGTDDQVSVKRKVLKDVKSEAGMIVRDNTLERHFITEIQNLHTKPVEIVVKETVPTGRNDKIRSEVLKDNTTAGFEADSNNIKGLLRWEFPLDAKAKKDVKLGWKVSWPKDTELSGL